MGGRKGLGHLRSGRRGGGKQGGPRTPDGAAEDPGDASFLPVVSSMPPPPPTNPAPLSLPRQKRVWTRGLALALRNFRALCFERFLGFPTRDIALPYRGVRLQRSRLILVRNDGGADRGGWAAGKNGQRLLSECSARRVSHPRGKVPDTEA
ncbi:hypothetical protein R6Z07F_007377 [Ovis aries]